MHLFHKWAAKSAQRREYYSPTGILPASTETVVLYGCTRCPRSKTETYTGEWSVEDFQ